MIEIRAPQTEDELQSIYRLRYEVYVTEMKRNQRHADHDQKLITEPLDTTAIIIGAFDGQCAVGTVRSNMAANTDLLFYPELYNMSCVGSCHPGRTSVTTKFVVARRFRGTALPVRMAAAIYKAGVERGVEFDFIDCTSVMIPLYQRLGYRCYQQEVIHPEYGSVMPMILAVNDSEHLRSVRSPLRSAGESAGTPGRNLKRRGAACPPYKVFQQHGSGKCNL